MELNKALSLLAVNENATENDIQQALSSKLTELTSKKQAAPTDALKAKFDTIIAQHQQAAELLLSQAATEPQTSTEPLSTSNTSSRSALSKTKLADLPGMAMADSQQVELQPGTILLGRYEVKELVGQGGMGAVYRVYDQIRSEDIAIKVLLPSLTKNERALERFLNEAKISSKLSHSNIVNVYDVQKDTEAGQDDLYFLTMELLEGQDLRQIMDNQTTVGRPFEIDDIKEYVQGITDGLNHAHKFTVHRDIKPENIWITEEGEVKLMDFGIAQLQSTSQRTQTGAAMGTAYYMAPEQLKGKSDIDGRADQYAVAVLMYELLTGEVPAGMIEPVNEARPDAPTPMVDAIHQALKPKPENRFTSMDEFNEQVQSSKGGKSSNKIKKDEGSNSVATTINYTPIIIVVLLVIAAFGGVQFNNHLQEQNRLQIKEEQRIAEVKRKEEQRINKEKVLKEKQAKKKAAAAKKRRAMIAKAIGKFVNIPKGSFLMGNADSSMTKPIHRVKIKAFKMATKEVTFNQWDACVKDGGCSFIPKDYWGRGNHPVINVKYNSITQQYIPWLNKLSGKRFRLPTEAEWEYAARAGSTTLFSFGDGVSCSYANYEYCLPKPGDKHGTTNLVGSYDPNQWGLYDMHGNAWEFTQDCKNYNYEGAPGDGSAWLSGDCSERMVRGGSAADSAYEMGSASRSLNRSVIDGFRLVQSR
jgi:formylglycine-generating enzyme required for sulfatase activity